MYCGNCGKEISDQAVACPGCSQPTALARGATPVPAAGAMGAGPLRPLAIGEILDVAIRLYRDHFGTLLKVVAVVVVPVQILSVLIQASAQPTGRTFADPDAIDAAAIGALVVAAITTLVLGVVATQVASAASLKAVGDAYLGHRPEVGESLRFAFSKLASLLLIMLLMILVIGGGFIGVLIPSVVFAAVAGPLGVLVVVLAMLAVGVGATWLYVGWSLAIPSLLVEDTRGWSALQRSLRLVRGRWWPTFAVLLVGFVVTFIVTGVLGAVFLVPFSLSGESTASFLVQGLASAIAEVLTLPFMAALIAIVYFDLRVRKEGLDLELMALGLGDLPPLRGDRPSPPQGTPPPPATPPPTWRPDEGGGAWEDHGRE